MENKNNKPELDEDGDPLPFNIDEITFLYPDKSKPVFLEYLEKFQQARNNIKRLRKLRAEVSADEVLIDVHIYHLKELISNKIDEACAKLLDNGETPE